ncbi:esterase/lipase family protein [Noviherbaspirillum sp.]|uniref:esterase/lipase family protein n=1 Tax=Noviherbaspirillum sp. TaxID=1926288 RepID=UPI002FDFD75C
MITLNAISSSPMLLALEPYHALCNYIAGHMQPTDFSENGDGHPVLVIPGLGSSGAATADLRMRLQQLGYATYDWKQGVNTGHGFDLDRWLLLLTEQVEAISDQHTASVSVIGWSLGGIYARELAMRCPHLIRQVITLATPFNAADLSQYQDGHHRVSSTSIYSQTDGIVKWEMCKAPESGAHRNIEVQGVSHFGMVHHPVILNVLAQLLKQPATTSDYDVQG